MLDTKLLKLREVRLVGRESKIPDPGLRAMATHTLVDHAANGNEEAIRAVCERLWPRLVAWGHGRLPRSARDLLETQDIVQEAMVRSLRQLQGFDNSQGGSLLGYMKTAVMNAIRNEIRRVSVRPLKVTVDEEVRGSSSSPVDELISQEVQAQYEEALAQLAPDEQDLVIGRLELQMSFQELALHTGKPSPDAARKATNRAIEKLATKMKVDNA